MSKRGFQFQVGLSLMEFYKLFGTEFKCQRHFESQKWPDGFKCRQCSCSEYSVSKRGTQKLYSCRKCHYQESLRSRTLLHGSQQGFMVWYLAIQLISQSKNCISALELHRQLNVSYNTAWLIKHKIMQMMSEETRQLSGYIEVAEVYLENSPVEHQQAEEEFKPKQRPFVAALETSADGRPLALSLFPVKSFDKKNMKEWLDKNLAEACETICDSPHCYDTLCALCKNKAHLKFFPKTESKKINWLNIIISNIKASIYGTFHSIDFVRYGYRYLADLEYRFNRRFNLKAMFYELISSASQAPHAVFFKPDPITGQEIPVE